MQKINDWENMEAATGESEQLPAGGYICKILRADDTTTSTGKKMIKFGLEIAEGPMAGYARRKYDNKVKFNTSAKWPLTFQQLYEGNSARFFKGVITSIEESNPGYKWDFDEKLLAGKRVGVIFAEEEFIGTDGQPHVAVKARRFTSVRNIMDGNFKIPERKTASAPEPAFTDINLDECPF